MALEDLCAHVLVDFEQIAALAVLQHGAMRGDTAIINMHQAMLQHSERGDLLNVYQNMSEQILKRHA